MAKIFRRERFAIFKNRNNAKKAYRFEQMVRAKLDGDIVLMDGVFHLDGKEVFRAEDGTTREWQMWHQLFMSIDEGKFGIDRIVARNNRSKKNWYVGKDSYKSSSRGLSCITASLRRTRIDQDKGEKGIKS